MLVRRSHHSILEIARHRSRLGGHTKGVDADGPREVRPGILMATDHYAYRRPDLVVGAVRRRVDGSRGQEGYPARGADLCGDGEVLGSIAVQGRSAVNLQRDAADVRVVGS